ncbi:MAG: cupin domain-containing protein [Pseudonocardiaceae bacterium]
MDHRLVQQVEKALGWAGPEPLGAEFGFGPMPDPSLCNRLLTPRKLLALILRRSLTYPQLRCLQHGTDLHPTAYLTATTTGRGQHIEVADMHRLGCLLREGATLVLDDVGPLDATLEIACRALSWWAGEATRVNTYLTTQDSSGWGLHWDSHDVLCIQLAGQKSWEVRGPSRRAPMERDAAPNPEPSNEIVWSGTMRAGDVMHIPRGWWHQATRAGKGGGFSLHATFGLTRRTGVDWLAWVADQARADELFRRDLHQHGTPDNRDAQQRELAAAATRLVQTYSPSDYLSTRQRERASTRQVTTLGVVGPPDAVACVTEFPPQLHTHDGKAIILAAGKKITVPAHALLALHPLLSGQPASIHEITRATGVDVAALADALIAAGICAEITPDLAEGYAGMLTPTAT